MYRTTNQKQLEFPNFYLPFSGHLDPENRWVALAQLVPWELAEEIYHADLREDFGAPIVPARTALGALLIKEKLGLTDRETVAAIQENPYLQFFIGFEEFTQKSPFDASLMVEFRKRFGEDGIQKIAETIALTALQNPEEEAADDNSNHDNSNHDKDPKNSASKTTPDVEIAPPKNDGRLIVDATCTPADIRFPTDISLLNEAREKTDAIIDELHLPLIGKEPRPRTYRIKAQKVFAGFITRKKPGWKLIRKTKKKLLACLRRNFKAIDALLGNPKSLPLGCFSRRMYKNLLVCRELFRQQLEMFELNRNRVADRIVSISQPHVRPIKRGKARNATEFGAKISLSVVNGFSFVDRLSWDSYNESLDLIGQIESYHRRFGFYPESVHADQIYRTRKNRAYCKLYGIRLSGPPLGRPPMVVSQAEKKQASIDEGIRSQVEGKFGQGKRRFGLGLIMTKLATTSATQISLSFLVMNLEEALKRFFLPFVFAWRVRLRVDHGSRTRPMSSRKCSNFRMDGVLKKSEA